MAASAQNLEEKFGTLLRRSRAAAGLNLGGVARRVGFSRAWLSYVERGRRVPSWALVEALTDLLGGAGVPKEEVMKIQDAGKRLISANDFFAPRKTN
ncbi:MAG: helix-turn-helix domain-containing protein [Elusimicrobia bacterium]|nr:helix-turn-helix domain-containing protein [Elusimicrobiota bacterium]